MQQKNKTGKTNILSHSRVGFKKSILYINKLDAAIQVPDCIDICPDSLDKQDILC